MSRGSRVQVVSQEAHQHTHTHTDGRGKGEGGREGKAGLERVFGGWVGGGDDGIGAVVVCSIVVFW